MNPRRCCGTAFASGHAGKAPVVFERRNWGEVYYNTMREVSQDTADQIALKIASLPIELVEADLHLTKQAAIYKATCKMSYADCFGAALAKIKNAEFVTGDSEFKEVEKEIKINWLTK